MTNWYNHSVYELFIGQFCGQLTNQQINLNVVNSIMSKKKKTPKQLHREKNKIYVKKLDNCEKKCKTKRKRGLKDWRKTIKP